MSVTQNGRGWNGFGYFQKVPVICRISPEAGLFKRFWIISYNSDFGNLASKAIVLQKPAAGKCIPAANYISALLALTLSCGNRMMPLRSLYDMGKLPMSISAINLAPNVKASQKRFS